MYKNLFKSSSYMDINLKLFNAYKWLMLQFGQKFTSAHIYNRLAQ